MKGFDRKNIKGGFTPIPNSILLDRNLSMKAKGALAIMLSRVDDWQFSVRGLCTLCGEGKDAIRAALKELEENGYLRREQIRDGHGKFGCSTYVFQEESSMLRTSQREKPLTENPSTENPSLLNRERINNPPISPVFETGESAENEKTAKWNPEGFAKFWQSYDERRRGKKQFAINAWDKLKPDDNLLAMILSALSKQTDSGQWHQGVGIPYAATYLSKCMWESEVFPQGKSDTDSSVLKYLKTIERNGREVDIF